MPDYGKWMTKVVGIFNPKITDTLKPDAIEHVGQMFLFQYSWIIDEDESKTYAGQWAMQILKPQLERMCAWCPEEDVDVVIRLKD